LEDEDLLKFMSLLKKIIFLIIFFLSFNKEKPSGNYKKKRKKKPSGIKIIKMPSKLAKSSFVSSETPLCIIRDKCRESLLCTGRILKKNYRR
jgi:hypothetical protein